jgi:uncharacterized membrane protein YidH (DUF202 family)
MSEIGLARQIAPDRAIGLSEINMERDKSDWKFSPDILFTLTLCAGPIIGVSFLAWFFHEITNVRRGNLTLFWIAVSVAIIGLSLLFTAKLSLYRQNKFFTFGSKTLAEKHKIVYRIAHYLIVASMLIMLLLMVMLAMLGEMGK